jgi:predicted nucleic acid-binding protein
VKVIVDTGFIVAFVCRPDRHHDWAVGLEGELTGPLLTCEPVLAEAAFQIGDTLPVLGMVEDGLLQIAFDCNDHLPQLGDLARRYADRKPDLADLCLIRMSELYPKHRVVTTDMNDFRVYRRNKREAIPLICPPDK